MSGGGVREIKLTKGYVALVDADCFDWLSQWRWQVRTDRAGIAYAQRSVLRFGATPDGKTMGMHRVVAGAGPGEIVDHRDGDGLNNRRANLRICTPRENAWNAAHKPGVSGYRGVHKSGNRWMARISYEGISRYLGTFVEELDAARAYDAAALKYHGQFAYLNFPADGQRGLVDRPAQPRSRLPLAMSAAGG